MGIDRLQLTSSPPCWMTTSKRILTSLNGSCHSTWLPESLLSLGNGFKPPTELWINFVVSLDKTACSRGGSFATQGVNSYGHSEATDNLTRLTNNTPELTNLQNKPGKYESYSNILFCLVF